jgi:hypothetical protein
MSEISWKATLEARLTAVANSDSVGKCAKKGKARRSKAQGGFLLRHNKFEDARAT